MLVANIFQSISFAISKHHCWQSPGGILQVLICCSLIVILCLINKGWQGKKKMHKIEISCITCTGYEKLRMSQRKAAPGWAAGAGSGEAH